jgi:hypothetical protein
MTTQVKRPQEMTQQGWEKRWDKIKIRVHVIAEDIAAVMGPRNYPRNWGEIHTCTNTLLVLGKIVQRSDAKRSWCGDPVATIEKLIKRIVTIDEPELATILAELETLSHEVEEMTSFP